jgi:phage gp29-like protein
MELRDQFGQVVEFRKPALEEQAVPTVRDRYSTYPSANLTPQRLAAILKEADAGDVFRQAELFEEFEEKWPALQADLQTRKLAVAGLSWEIQPASPSAEDQKIAAAVREMLDYIEDFEGALFDALDAVAKGFSVQEIFWELVGREVWVKRLKWVHQKRFTFYSPEALLEFPRLLTDAQPVAGEELTPFKFVYHRHRARSGAAARGGLSRPLAYVYLFSQLSLKDWAIFNDLYSVPMRVGKYKPGATKPEIDALKQAVFNLGTDAAAVLSDSTVVELLETKNRAGDVPTFKGFIDWAGRMTSKVVLGHTGSSEATPGRLGGENVARQIRQDLLEHDARALQNTLKFQLIWPWVAFQFGKEKACPDLIFHCEAQKDLLSLANTYGDIVQRLGFRKISLQHIHRRFGIPEPLEGEETVDDLLRHSKPR